MNPSEQAWVSEVGTGMPIRSGPLTQATVENELLRILALMEERTEDFATYSMEAAEAEAAHKSLFAQAFIKSDATSDIRRREDATLRTAAVLKSRLLSAAVKESCKESLLSLRAELDALRSISANIRGQT